jgi:HlyD family secretion protein
VIWKRQETQARSPDLLREPRFGSVITGIDEFVPLEFAWCSVPTPTSPRTRLRGVTLAGNLLILCFVLGLGMWSGFAPLESAAAASGVVESESSRKTIQHLEGGIIRKILVADGDVVRAGQTLISLEDTKPVPKSRACRASCGTRRHEKHGCRRNSTGTSGYRFRPSWK